MQRLILVVFVLGLSLIGCRKGSLPEEYYFGKVSVSAFPTSDLPDLDVYFENQKIGTVASSGASSSFTMSANKSGKLSIYKASTDSLVADTAITIIQNSTVYLKVICSDLLGVKGFINNDSSVGADSVKLQFIYNFDSPFYSAYTEVDLHILKGADREDIGVVVKGLKMGELNSQTITLLHIEDESGIIYYGMLKDVATGEFIKMKYRDRDYFTLIPRDANYNGHMSIAVISDDDGDETSSKIISTVNIL